MSSIDLVHWGGRDRIANIEDQVSRIQNDGSLPYVAEVVTTASAADNAAAINDAVTRAKAKNTSIFVPAGNYNIEGGQITIDPWSGFKMRGAGASLTTLTNTSTDGSNAITVTPSGSVYFVGLSDMAINGNTSSGHGLYFTSTSTNVIGWLGLKRLWIATHGGDCLRLDGTLDAAYCEQLECSFATSNAIGFASTNFISNIVFVQCFAARSGVGLYPSGQIGTLTWTGGEMSYNGIGLRADALLSTQVVNRLKVQGTTFEGNTTNQARLASSSAFGWSLENTRINDTAATKLTEHYYIDGKAIEIKRVSVSNMSSSSAAVVAIKGTADTVEITGITGVPSGSYAWKDFDGTLYTDTSGPWVRGGHTRYTVAKTATYTAAVQDRVVLADATSAAFTVTLPTAAHLRGKEYTVKKTDSWTNAVTVGTTSSQTIDGSTTYSLAAQYNYVSVISDGTNWLIVGSG